MNRNFYFASEQIFVNKKCMTYHQEETGKEQQQNQCHKKEFQMKTKMLTESQLADWLHISKSTLHKLREEGNIPYQLIGSCIRYSTEEIEKWLESNSFNQGRVE